MTTEKPILFNTEMVRAVLGGNKTQTRRVIKPQPTHCGLEFRTACDGDFSAWQDEGLVLDEYSDDGGPCQRVCPYGAVGDRLWVRETMEVDSVLDLAYVADDELVMADTPDDYYYREPEYVGKIPSIFMPRWASRINLEITDIRVERVQDISPTDAYKEGCNSSTHSMPTLWFKTLWNSINLKRGLGWDKNPWVWVVEFKRIECQR